MIVLLMARDLIRYGTASYTAWSGIFADENTQTLDETELNVFKMVKSMPQNWSCGCVIGYPEHSFSETDQKLFEIHGMGKRFSL